MFDKIDDIGGTNGLMMLRREVLGEVVSKVSSSAFPMDMKLTLSSAIA